jgi:NADH-quinone oxidoreductase subunit L
MYFLVFHGKEHFHHKPFPPETDDAAHADDSHGHGDDHGHADGHGHDHTPHESPWVVTLPLILLAVPSVVIGFVFIGPMLYGDFFKDAIFFDLAKHPAMEELAAEFHGAAAMALHSLTTLPTWLALAGVVASYVMYMVVPQVPAAIKNACGPIYRLLENKYYLDAFNEHVLAAGSRLIGRGLWKGGDVGLIDGLFVNGSARSIGRLSGVVRLAQSGYLYWYALVMILGVIGLMTWQLWPFLTGLLGQ